MNRILQNTASKVRLEIRDADGDLKNVDTATTVSATVKDGAGVQVSTGTAAAVSGATGTYEYPLTANDTATLDTYTVDWAFTLDGAAQKAKTRFEVAGGFLFTVGEARTFEEGVLTSKTKYPTTEIVRVRELAEETLEGLCEVAFVPRGRRVTIDGSGDDTLILPNVLIREIVSVTLDGTALTASELAELEPYRDGRLVWPNRTWTADRRNVVVHYTHGYDEPPEPATRAGLLLAKHRLVRSNIDDRALSFTDELGTRQFAVAGQKRPTGIPEVDAIVMQLSMRTPRAG